MGNRRFALEKRILGVAYELPMYLGTSQVNFPLKLPMVFLGNKCTFGDSLLPKNDLLTVMNPQR